METLIYVALFAFCAGAWGCWIILKRSGELIDHDDLT